jgi:hypothetical protein
LGLELTIFAPSPDLPPLFLLMSQSSSPEVRQIIQRVLQLEKDRLDRKKNSPINDDILQIIKEIVR